jgi:aspartate-semialdehyde dehydrogenase
MISGSAIAFRSTGLSSALQRHVRNARVYYATGDVFVQPYRVGIAGATGLVGQRLVARVSDHPWFRLAALGASERSSGSTYREATRWMLPQPMPEAAASLRVSACRPRDFAGCDLVLSALGASVAIDLEPVLARDGIAVVSNSSALRMAGDVPLLVPEVNADHVTRIAARAGQGFVVTNPNCSVTGLALALAPLDRAFGVRRVIVATMQSISGAGLAGPRAIDLLDNVVPYIANEEDKIEEELGKILGRATPEAFTRADILVSAHCHRVPTLDGHLEAVSVEFERACAPETAIEAFASFRGDIGGMNLPTAPESPIVVRREPDRPQTRLDRDCGAGMTVVVGRVRPCPVLTLRFVLLSHNMVRGAAGAAILNAELLAARGLLPRRSGA